MACARFAFSADNTLPALGHGSVVNVWMENDTRAHHPYSAFIRGKKEKKKMRTKKNEKKKPWHAGDKTACC